jgi:hypothetical protein
MYSVSKYADSESLGPANAGNESVGAPVLASPGFGVGGVSQAMVASSARPHSLRNVFVIKIVLKVWFYKMVKICHNDLIKVCNTTIRPGFCANK